MTKEARQIKKWRKERGHLQSKAARLLRTTQPNISRIERGERPPSVAVIRRFAAIVAKESAK